MHESWMLNVAPTHLQLKVGFEAEVLISRFSLDIEKQDYESKFKVVPPPFTQEERERWLSQLSEVAVSSDAFVSHDNDKPLRNR